MAYTSSGQLPLGSSYKLGGYTFSLDTRTIPQTDLRDVTARCTAPGGKHGIRNVQIPAMLAFNSWSIEANESEASIYVKIADEPDTYPDHISVIQPPYKLNYKSYERIDLTGAEVQAFNADGTIWSCDKYPNGIIPVNELTIEPTTAEPSLPPYGIIDTSAKGLNYTYRVKIAICNHYYARYTKNYKSDYYESIDVIAKNGYDLIVEPFYGRNSTLGNYYAVAISATKKIGIAEELDSINETAATVNWKERFWDSYHAEVVTIDQTTDLGKNDWYISYDDLKCRENDFYGIYFPYTKIADFESTIPFAKSDYIINTRDYDKQPAVERAYLKAVAEKPLKVAVNWRRPVDGAILSSTYDITIE